MNSMKVVAGICGCIVLIFLVAWLLFLDLQSRIIALLLIAVVSAALGALIAFCYRVQKRLNQIEEKLDALNSKTEKPESDNASNHIGEWERLKK